MRDWLKRFTSTLLVLGFALTTATAHAQGCEKMTISAAMAADRAWRQ